MQTPQREGVQSTSFVSFVYLGMFHVQTMGNLLELLKQKILFLRFRNLKFWVPFPVAVTRTLNCRVNQKVDRIIN